MFFLLPGNGTLTPNAFVVDKEDDQDKCFMTVHILLGATQAPLLPPVLLSTKPAFSQQDGEEIAHAANRATRIILTLTLHGGELVTCLGPSAGTSLGARGCTDLLCSCLRS